MRLADDPLPLGEGARRAGEGKAAATHLPQETTARMQEAKAVGAHRAREGKAAALPPYASVRKSDTRHLLLALAPTEQLGQPRTIGSEVLLGL